VSGKWGEGGRKEGRQEGGEVGRRGKFWGIKGVEKSLGKGRGWVFGSSAKRLQ